MAGSIFTPSPEHEILSCRLRRLTSVENKAPVDCPQRLNQGLSQNGTVSTRIDPSSKPLEQRLMGGLCQGGCEVSGLRMDSSHQGHGVPSRVQFFLALLMMHLLRLIRLRLCFFLHARLMPWSLAWGRQARSLRRLASDSVFFRHRVNAGIAAMPKLAIPAATAPRRQFLTLLAQLIGSGERPCWERAVRRGLILSMVLTARDTDWVSSRPSPLLSKTRLVGQAF